MYFNRFDIMEAHYCFYSEYHSGVNSWMYKRMSKIIDIYTPSRMWKGYESLSDNGKEIYNNLVEKYV